MQGVEVRTVQDLEYLRNKKTVMGIPMNMFIAIVLVVLIFILSLVVLHLPMIFNVFFASIGALAGIVQQEELKASIFYMPKTYYYVSIEEEINF
ncbi:MAG: hypothetical protein QXP36_00085 [Conexivisphaerales archaeon]